jgi:hypothetical protein
MSFGRARSGWGTRSRAFGVVAAIVFVLAAVTARAGAAGSAPDLTTAVHYLVTATNANGVRGGTTLEHAGYYESFPGFADFGLTIDGALALAATHGNDAVLAKVVGFIAARRADGSGQTIDSWTGIGTKFVSGGSIAKEALLAEVTGFDPHKFAGHDLVAALGGTVCTAVDTANGCAAVGNYRHTGSTFAQAIGVIAQRRVGDEANAAPAITYLESLQNASGAWPSVIPSTGDSEVDSTAIAAMALDGEGGASAAVTKALAWIASQQQANGSFAGAAGESTNTTALAIQALSLASPTYDAQIALARQFLAAEQNVDGGFSVASAGAAASVAASAAPSDVRATTQVVGGSGGNSFLALADNVSARVTAEPTPTTTTTVAPASTTTTTVPVSIAASTPPTTSVGPAATLPVTGAPSSRGGGIAAMLLLCGVAATAVARRRTSR